MISLLSSLGVTRVGWKSCHGLHDVLAIFQTRTHGLAIGPASGPLVSCKSSSFLALFGHLFAFLPYMEATCMQLGSVKGTGTTPFFQFI